MLSLKDFKKFEISTPKVFGGITKAGVEAVIAHHGCFGDKPAPQCDNICQREIELEGGGTVFVNC